MKPARIILLAVALLAGGLAAFLATRGDAPPPADTRIVSEVVEEARTRILVAAAPIGVGERLTPNLVEWLDWPTGALRDDYLTEDLLPNAPMDMAGTVARFEFFPGEPIRQIKLVRSDQGYLSAIIPQGMRAVSIGVTAESGAGGFINPNDRVDVVLSRGTTAGTVSETILSNIKVLAIGLRLGEVGASGDPEGEGPQSQTFTNSTIATLVMSPAQAESIINAGSVGELSLVLRSVSDFAPEDGALIQDANRSVRLIRFGNEMSVMTGGLDTMAADGPPASDEISSSSPVSEIVPQPINETPASSSTPSATAPSVPSPPLPGLIQ
jgi:pilus assembly protein CpaB